MPEEKVMNVRAYQSDLETIKELQEKWGCENQQEVVQKLVKSGMQMNSLENQLFEAQKRIRELEKQLNEHPSVDQDLTDKINALLVDSI
jgi:TRAP-type C4-dicarboxylate transport system substrate-binding protein